MFLSVNSNGTYFPHFRIILKTFSWLKDTSNISITSTQNLLEVFVSTSDIIKLSNFIFGTRKTMCICAQTVEPEKLLDGFNWKKLMRFKSQKIIGTSQNYKWSEKPVNMHLMNKQLLLSTLISVFSIF